MLLQTLLVKAIRSANKFNIQALISIIILRYRSLDKIRYTFRRNLNFIPSSLATSLYFVTATGPKTSSYKNFEIFSLV